LECYEKALELNAQNIETLHDKGVALEFLGRTQESLKCYEKVLEMDPNFELSKKAREEILSSKS
jgi:Tetratricopeptide repeat.